MNAFIFGFDNARPAQCAKQLRQHNIGAVVMGNPTDETALALEREGIALYLCYGAFSAGNGSAWAMDADGQSRLWFHSGCPNDKSTAQRLLQRALECARRLPSVRGVLVDGARFASFASAEGFDSFFTCFCPHCMQAMEEAGLDAQGIRRAVNTLAQKRAVDDPKPLTDWFRFRELCVQRYMDCFAQAVHELRPGLLAGAFVFAPSLAWFVGQTAQACRALDVVSPMLYRAYPHPEGPACLGHEWAAFLNGFGEAAPAMQRLNERTLPLKDSAAKLAASGFGFERIGEETTLARQALRPGQQLWPTLQIEDKFLHQTAQQALSHGADRVGYFAYGQAALPSA